MSDSSSLGNSAPPLLSLSSSLDRQMSLSSLPTAPSLTLLASLCLYVNSPNISELQIGQTLCTFLEKLLSLAIPHTHEVQSFSTPSVDCVVTTSPPPNPKDPPLSPIYLPGDPCGGASLLLPVPFKLRIIKGPWFAQSFLHRDLERMVRAKKRSKTPGGNVVLVYIDSSLVSPSVATETKINLSHAALAKIANGASADFPNFPFLLYSLTDLCKMIDAIDPPAETMRNLMNFGPKYNWTFSVLNRVANAANANGIVKRIEEKKDEKQPISAVKIPPFVPPSQGEVKSPNSSTAAANSFKSSPLASPLAISAEATSQLDMLRESFQSRNLVLVLGAGVSMEAKLPSWDRLMQDLLLEFLQESKVPLDEKERSFVLEQMTKSTDNPLLMARYLRAGLGDSFGSIVSRILYKNCTGQSCAIDALADLCVKGGGVKAICTYNFDDLLEAKLESLNFKHRSVYAENMQPKVDEMGVYHVHGFLPRSLGFAPGGPSVSSLSYPSQPSPSSVSPDMSKSMLVFAEEGYLELGRDPFHWSNLTQFNFLRSSVCLFVGVSMRDPNLRRLLDTAAKKQNSDEPKHFVLMIRPSIANEIPAGSGLKAENIKLFDIANQALQEQMMKELGVNIIWFDKYSEVPIIIKAIAGS